MATDATSILLAGTGTLSVATLSPTPPTFPTDYTSALSVAFKDVGLIKENGVTIKPGLSAKNWKAWQSGGYPVRTAITQRTLDIEVEMEEAMSQTPFVLAMGGGTWTPGTGAAYSYTPPTGSSVDERGAVLDISDGTKVMRLIAYRTLVTALGDFNVQREEITSLKITLSALLPTTGPVWQIYATK